MKPTDLERLIHEALETLGWDANPKELADKVVRLNIGLPLEDEFSVLCGWLGQCKLVHKLDQQQYPSSSKNEYQVPDLMAVFEVDESSLPVLIEVKSSHKNVLSLTPKYVEKLENYAALMSMPVLIAWKNKAGIWTLNSLESFTKAERNLNLNFGDAFKNSLMSLLVGDFGYSLGAGAGVHIQAKKIHSEKIVDKTEKRVENWKTIIDDVYFTSYNDEVFRDLSPIAQQVFFSWDLAEDQTINDTHLIMHNYCDESSMLFAQMALTRVLSFHQNETEQHLRWRSILGEQGSISVIDNFRKGIEECLKKKVVHHLIDFEPEVLPTFLQRIK